MDTLGHGIYTPMDVSLLPPLHLIYAENPSDSGKVGLSYCFSLVGQFVHGSTHSNCYGRYTVQFAKGGSMATSL